jgi:putative glycosyltransferase (TIGR04372 family)
MARTYFSFHHRFLAWLGRLTNTIVLCPNPVSIGNASEDYYFGLIKARREGKKLVVLFPFEMPGPFKIRMFDPAILYLESDLLAMKYRGKASSFFSAIFTLYFIAVRVLVILLHKLFGVRSTGYYWRPLAGQDILWRPSPGQLEFDWQLAQDQQWRSQLSVPLELRLPQKLIDSCELKCAQMGLPRDVKFVCLHVREGGFFGDWENPRNASIYKYVAAVQEITKRGMWVVRMGDAKMAPLPALDCVIDYAHAPNRNALLDVYLIGKCNFFIGTSSGIYDTACMLGKPVILTNMTHWLNIVLPKKGDLMLFKHVHSIKDKRELSIQEWIERAPEITTKLWASPDWTFIENSEDEIVDAVKEMFGYNIHHERSLLQGEFKKAHLSTMYRLGASLRFDSEDLENCNDWFRFASRILTWEGDVSDQYLAKNWNLNSVGTIERSASISAEAKPGAAAFQISL